MVSPDGAIGPCCAAWETREDFGQLDDAAGQGYLDVVYSESFTSVRDIFAGRGVSKPELICERCNATHMMDYGRHIDRRIAVMLAARLFRPLRRTRRISG